MHRLVAALILAFALGFGTVALVHHVRAAPACAYANAGLSNGSVFTAGQYVGVNTNASCPAAAGSEIDFVLSGAAWQVHVVSLAGTSSTFAGTQFMFSTAGFAPGVYSVTVSANGTPDRQGALSFTVN